LNAIPEAPRRRQQRQLGVRVNAYKPSLQTDAANDWDMAFGPSNSSRRCTKAPKRTNERSRDIRDMIAGSIARTAALVVQGELEEGAIEQEDSSQVFDARLHAASQLRRTRSGPKESMTATEIPDEDLLALGGLTSRPTVRPSSSEKLTESVRPQKRRRTTESRRTKSSRLPLERVPDNAQMQDTILQLPTSIEAICSSIDKLDEWSNFISWHEKAKETYNTFSLAPDSAEIKEWARRITDGIQQTCEVEDEEEAEGIEGRVVAALACVKWS